MFARTESEKRPIKRDKMMVVRSTAALILLAAAWSSNAATLTCTTTSGLAVDADGAPNSYLLNGNGLSFTCDGVFAMVEGVAHTQKNDKAHWQTLCRSHWKEAQRTGNYSQVKIVGFMQEKSGPPVVQGEGDPLPGKAYVTTTTLTIPSTPAQYATPLRECVGDPICRAARKLGEGARPLVRGPSSGLPTQDRSAGVRSLCRLLFAWRGFRTPAPRSRCRSYGHKWRRDPARQAGHFRHHRFQGSSGCSGRAHAGRSVVAARHIGSRWQEAGCAGRNCSIEVLQGHSAIGYMPGATGWTSRIGSAVSTSWPRLPERQFWLRKDVRAWIAEWRLLVEIRRCALVLRGCPTEIAPAGA